MNLEKWNCKTADSTGHCRTLSQLKLGYSNQILRNTQARYNLIYPTTTELILSAICLKIVRWTHIGSRNRKCSCHENNLCITVDLGDVEGDQERGVNCLDTLYRQQALRGGVLGIITCLKTIAEWDDRAKPQ
jgi:hypothetical protein